MHRCFSGRCALVFLLARKFDNQDCIFGGQANKYDETYLRQDVDRHAACQQAAHRGEETHRHNQNDRYRQLPALVLSHEHKKHEKSRCTEDKECGNSALLLLERKICPLESDSLRENLAGKSLHAEQRSTRGNTRSRYTLHFRGWKKIVARHTIRDRVVLQLCHRTDRHHFTGSIANFQARNVRLVASVLAVGLDDYFVRPAEQVEIVHVLGAQIDLQRRKHVGRGDSYLLRLHAINVRVDGG